MSESNIFFLPPPPLRLNVRRAVAYKTSMQNDAVNWNFHRVNTSRSTRQTSANVARLKDIAYRVAGFVFGMYNKVLFILETLTDISK